MHLALEAHTEKMAFLVCHVGRIDEGNGRNGGKKQCQGLHLGKPDENMQRGRAESCFKGCRNTAGVQERQIWGSFKPLVAWCKLMSKRSV